MPRKKASTTKRRAPTTKKRASAPAIRSKKYKRGKRG